MPTFLQGIAKKAEEQPKHRFGNLYELLNEVFLTECWPDIRKDAAYGVDRLSGQDYEQNLNENLHWHSYPDGREFESTVRLRVLSHDTAHFLGTPSDSPFGSVQCPEE